MKVVVTPTCREAVLLIVDIETGQIEKIDAQPEQWSNMPSNPRGPDWRRFGISWSSDTLFVASRYDMLLFDRDFQYKGKMRNILCGNPHQIVHKNDELFVTQTVINNVIAFDATWRQRVVFAESGQSHFNSLLLSDDKFWLGASHCGPSRLHELNTDSRTLTGTHCHNLAYWDDDICWLDTLGTGWLTTGKRSCAVTDQQEFARGLAISASYIIVGLSPFGSRAPYTETAHIQVLDKSGNKISRIALPGSGAINDLRLIDAYDFAHLKEPFL
jgi:hypothetical protein